MAASGEGRRPRVLIVEDNYLIAMEMKAMIERFGCSVAGPVAGVEDALGAVEAERPDGAVLDVELAAETVWPVAERLEELRVPFLFATGRAAVEVPPRFRDRLLLLKPVSRTTLGEALAGLGLIDP